MEEPLKKQNDLFDAKSLHELLYDHQSQDFKKSRRNLMVIAFVVITVWCLGLELTNLKVFGLNLDKLPVQSRIHWVGIVLIGYWWVMFEFYRKRDKDIHSLHHDIIHKKINDLKNEIPLFEKEYKELKKKLKKNDELKKDDELKKKLKKDDEWGERSTSLPSFFKAPTFNPPAMPRLMSQAEHDHRNNLFQQIQDRKYAVNLFNESNNRNKPALKWVLIVEKMEIQLPRVLAFYSLFFLFLLLII